MEREHLAKAAGPLLISSLGQQQVADMLEACLAAEPDLLEGSFGVQAVLAAVFMVKGFQFTFQSLSGLGEEGRQAYRKGRERKESDGDLERVRLLLLQGADRGGAVLCELAAGGDLAGVRILLDAACPWPEIVPTQPCADWGSQPGQGGAGQGWHGMGVAGQQGWPPGPGLDVSLQGQGSPLHWVWGQEVLDGALPAAVQAGDLAVTQLLLERGANPNAEDGKALHLAVTLDHFKICDALLRSGELTKFFLMELLSKVGTQ